MNAEGKEGEAESASSTNSANEQTPDESLGQETTSAGADAPIQSGIVPTLEEGASAVSADEIVGPVDTDAGVSDPNTGDAVTSEAPPVAEDENISQEQSAEEPSEIESSSAASSATSADLTPVISSDHAPLDHAPLAVPGSVTQGESSEEDASSGQSALVEAGADSASESAGVESQVTEKATETAAGPLAGALQTALAVAQQEEVEESPAEDASAEVASQEEQSQENGELVVEGAIVEGAEEPKKEVHPDARWYVIHAYSGYEQKAKRALEERIRTHNLEPLFGEVHVPEETVVELVRGQKKTTSRKFFPGYMLVQMVLNQDTWHLVKETPKITGFIGDESDPEPLSPEEVSRIMEQVEEGAASPRARMTFEHGETVKVVDGPFADFNGTVEEVKPEKGKVRVLISIFGRATPVELDFIQVEKT